MRPRNSHIADKLRRNRANAAWEGLFRSVGACPRRSEVVRSVRLHARRMDLSRQERYRVHRGAYRITYEIQDDVLTVVAMKVGRRSDVYQGN